MNEVKRLKAWYKKKIEDCDTKYKEYPCYKTISELDLTLYNQNYNYVPWINLFLDDEKIE